jgi:release factor glutamine methyltransferase
VNVQARLENARQQLADALDLPVDEARLEAQILLRHALGNVSRAWLMAHGEQALNSAQIAHFQGFLCRRLQGEPVAYILGQREFFGLEFAVTPDVLIPRPDTETLVEAALRCVPENKSCRVLDLGTGSGAIAIAIAVYRPLARLTATDCSEAALKVAHGNAEGLSAGNVRLLRSDWFSALEGEVFDVIVSNPPYIAATDPHLNQGDLRFEPSGALVSGKDGLDDIRAIVAQVPAHLAPGGWLLLEHGYDQAERVAALLEDAGFKDVGHAADLAGIARVTLGRKVQR